MSFDNLPDELKAVPHWVCWKAVPDPNSHSGISKIPINPRTGGRAQSNNSGTWTDFDTAVSASSRFSGIGFMFSGSGFFGVDIDDKPDALEAYRSGDKNNVIAEFIDTLKSYAEYSQSGNGIHILCKGKLPPGRRKKGSFEMYDSGRFFVTTGNPCAEYTKIIDCTESIKPLHAKYIDTESGRKKPRPPKQQRTAPTPGEVKKNVSDLSVDDLLKKAQDDPAFIRLWNGDTFDCGGDHSVADFRLCVHLARLTQGDADQIDRLFRHSGLMRDKWDRRQSGTTYGAITIERAIEKWQADLEDVCPLPDFTFDDLSSHKADDIGAAEFFASLVQDFLCYCPEERTFYLYNGVMWEQDAVKEHIKAGRLLMKFVATAQRLIPPPPPGSKQDWTDEQKKQEQINKAFRDQYRNLGSANGRERLIKDVKKLLYKPRNAFDRQPYLLNCLNCTVDLDTGTAQDHAATDLLTRCCNANYDPDAKNERFDRFIDEICEGDQEQIDSLQRALGYSLIGATPEECFFIAFGKSTRNGKGTLFDLVLDTLGDYGAQMDFDVIARSGTKDASRATPELARLIGVRYVLVNEPQKGTCFNEGLTKQLTGSDNITARPLYGSTIEFKPLFTLYITTNNLPAISDDTLFTSDRIRIIPFNRHFSESERDVTLKSTLREGNGRDAVLTWLIEGYRKYKESGLTDTKASQAIVRQYRAENDYIQQFIDERLIVPDPNSGTKHKERLTEVMAHYNIWCGYYNIKPLGKKLFREELEKHGITIGYPHGQYYAAVTIRQIPD